MKHLFCIAAVCLSACGGTSGLAPRQEASLPLSSVATPITDVFNPTVGDTSSTFARMIVFNEQTSTHRISDPVAITLTAGQAENTATLSLLGQSYLLEFNEDGEAEIETATGYVEAELFFAIQNSRLAEVELVDGDIFREAIFAYGYRAPDGVVNSRLGEATYRGRSAFWISSDQFVNARGSANGDAEIIVDFDGPGGVDASFIASIDDDTRNLGSVIFEATGLVLDDGRYDGSLEMTSAVIDAENVDLSISGRFGGPRANETLGEISGTYTDRLTGTPSVISGAFTAEEE